MFALQILHTCAMPLIKASILAFYVRLFPTRRFKLAVKVVFAYVFCWWISVLFATVFQCSPISHNWATEPSQLSGCDSNIMTMYEIAAFTNFVGDIAVLGLPVPIIAGLHMPSKRKVALLGIFLRGSLCVLASLISFIFTNDMYQGRRGRHRPYCRLFQDYKLYRSQLFSQVSPSLIL